MSSNSNSESFFDGFLKTIFNTCEDYVKEFKAIDSQLDELRDNSLPQIDKQSTDSKLKSFYDNQIHTDFDLKIIGSNDSIKVHKLVLILNDCKAIEAIIGHSFPLKEVSKKSLEVIVNSFYDKSLNDFNDNNIDEYIEIADQLANNGLAEELKTLRDKRLLVEKRKSLLSEMKTIEDSVKSSKRRMSSILLSQSKTKRLKSTDSSDKNWTNDNWIRSQESHSDLDSPPLVMDRGLPKTPPPSTGSEPLKPPIDVVEIKPIFDKSIEENDYKIVKYFKQTEDKTKYPTIVWNSCFVPKIFETQEMVAIVGETCVQWLALNEPYTQMATFESPDNKKLLSIGYTQTKTNNKMLNICAIGSEEGLYFCSESIVSEDKKVTRFATFGGFHEITAIVFHPTKPNVLFCGTNDKKVYVFNLVYDCDRIVLQDSFKPYPKWFDFAINSLLYLTEYDCLVASGDSPDLVFCFGISTEDRDLDPFRDVWFGQSQVRVPKREIKAITRMAFIPESKIIVCRSPQLDYLMTGQLDEMLENIDSKRSLNKTKAISIDFKQWSKLMYTQMKDMSETIYISHTSGLIACGDHCGHIYLYASNQINGKPIVKPLKILGNESDWSDFEELPIITSVAISDDKQYLISTTRSNLTCIWKINA